MVTAADLAVPELWSRSDMIGWFGQFGGQYVPESLKEYLAQLEEVFTEANNDPNFWAEYTSYFSYIGRPSSLHLAPTLTARVGGAQIYLKREDLNHTGSHNINNALGQILMARRLKKQRIVTDTGNGQHGLATATVCAKVGLPCVVYMGADDVHRQPLNVKCMERLGAQVVPVEGRSRAMRDAVSEALRDCIGAFSTSFYVAGSTTGPHPLPSIVSTFQRIVGLETMEQMREMTNRLPNAIVACVGGGSNAAGMFGPFLPHADVRLVGVEAAGEGVDTDRHSAPLTRGSIGVFHGAKSYVVQDEHGQIGDTHSLSSGMRYPGVGPQLAHWKDTGRVEVISVRDREALTGLRLLAETEGIVPALETSHAVWGAIHIARTRPKEEMVILCVSGRGEKDFQILVEEAQPILN